MDRTALTFRYERLRAIAAGILETSGTSFLLLIAVKWFQFGATEKALIAVGGSIGLLSGPAIVSLVESRQWHVSRAAAVLAAIGCVCFTVMALVKTETVFVLGSMAAAALSAMAIPLVTQIYQENYPQRKRDLPRPVPDWRRLLNKNRGLPQPVDDHTGTFPWR